MVPRLAIYGALSTSAAGLVIGSALRSRPNFFSAAVAVGRSSGALMVLANFALFNAICVGMVFKTIFFGRLRNVEYEHLFEKLWIFLTESLLALTIFKEDFSAPFAVMYGVLLFLKCFHWITADRIDYMDQVPPPGPPLLFHIRATLVIAFLSLADLMLVTYSLESILVDGVSAMVLFTSEFMILLAAIGGTWARYVIGLIDLRRARGRADAPSWEAKSMYLFYVDLAVDFAKLLTYLSFFAVILLHYGLPLHILRDVYMTFRSFVSRVSDLIRYRRATKDMDAQYPNATAAELDRMGDKTCIICREEMVPLDGGAGQTGDAGGPNETPKKLSCGHIFHFHCLRSWLERQQSCPTCRRDVLSAAILPNRRRGAAPPAAPGAAPQANAGNRQQPQNPIQAIYDQYFRPPPPQAFAPPPAPAAAPTAPPIPGQTGAPLTDGHAAPVIAPNGQEASQAQTDAQRIQNGIWGGPITPGKFFATPLGAAPTWPPSSSNTRLPPPLPTPTIPSLPSPSADLPRPTPSVFGDSSENSQVPGMDACGGPITPSVSQAPEIFSSVSIPRLEEVNGDGETAGEIDQRRAAAEAAMRRLGLSMPTSTPATSSASGEASVASQDPKGKGKASVPAITEDEERKYTPYLTVPNTVLAHSASSNWSTPSTAAEATRGLDERIRTLREVDEVVWSLVGDLTKLRSKWETEDANSLPASSVE